MMGGNDDAFIQAAHQVRKQSEAKIRGAYAVHQHADVIYEDPTTKAKVYCGNIEAAQSREFHTTAKVFHIINCQEEGSANFHEADRNYSYYRFPITKWGGMMHSPGKRRVTDFFMQPFNFIDSALKDGHNCLIHCLAGAHRAGTTSVAFLMYKHGLPYPNALRMAQGYRSIIGPFSWLIEMLQQYERELMDEGRIGGK